MIVTRTPYRVSLFGGGTDYDAWYKEHGGLVVGTSIARYCYLTVRNLPPFFEHKTRVVYSKTELVHDHSSIEHPSVRNCLQYMNIKDGLEIHHNGDLPAWSGIGSSSSFTVGLLHALSALKSEATGQMDLAKKAIYVEQELSKESVGVQDQILSSLGGMQVIELGNEIKTSSLDLSPEYLRSLEDHIMLGFSGQARISSINASLQIHRIRNGEIVSEMRELLSLAREGLKSLASESSIKEIARLISECWKIKRSFTDRVSNPCLDEIYNVAMENGAWGGRLLGAGGGGFFMFIVPKEKQQYLKDKLGQKIKVWIPVTFDQTGTKVIFQDTHQPL